MLLFVIIHLLGVNYYWRNKILLEYYNRTKNDECLKIAIFLGNKSWCIFRAVTETLREVTTLISLVSFLCDGEDGEGIVWDRTNFLTKIVLGETQAESLTASTAKDILARNVSTLLIRNFEGVFVSWTSNVSKGGMSDSSNRRGITEKVVTIFAVTGARVLLRTSSGNFGEPLDISDFTPITDTVPLSEDKSKTSD